MASKEIKKAKKEALAKLKAEFKNFFCTSYWKEDLKQKIMICLLKDAFRRISDLGDGVSKENILEYSKLHYSSFYLICVKYLIPESDQAFFNSMMQLIRNNTDNLKILAKKNSNWFKKVPESIFTNGYSNKTRTVQNFLNPESLFNNNEKKTITNRYDYAIKHKN